MTGELRLRSASESGEVESVSPLLEMPTESALEELFVRNQSVQRNCEGRRGRAPGDDLRRMLPPYSLTAWNAVLSWSDDRLLPRPVGWISLRLTAMGGSSSTN